MPSRQTLNELVYLRADHDYEIGSKAIFAQDNVAYDNVSSNKVL